MTDIVHESNHVHVHKCIIHVHTKSRLGSQIRVVQDETWSQYIFLLPRFEFLIKTIYLKIFELMIKHLYTYLVLLVMCNCLSSMGLSRDDVLEMKKNLIIFQSWAISCWDNVWCLNLLSFAMECIWTMRNKSYLCFSQVKIIFRNSLGFRKWLQALNKPWRVRVFEVCWSCNFIR